MKRYIWGICGPSTLRAGKLLPWAFYARAGHSSLLHAIHCRSSDRTKEFHSPLGRFGASHALHLSATPPWGTPCRDWPSDVTRNRLDVLASGRRAHTENWSFIITAALKCLTWSNRSNTSVHASKPGLTKLRSSQSRDLLSSYHFQSWTTFRSCPSSKTLMDQIITQSWWQNYASWTQKPIENQTSCLNTFNAHIPVRHANRLLSLWKLVKTIKNSEDKELRAVVNTGHFKNLHLQSVAQGLPFRFVRTSLKGSQEKRSWVQWAVCLEGGDSCTWLSAWCRPRCAGPQQSQKSRYAPLSSCSQLKPRFYSFNSSGWVFEKYTSIQRELKCLTHRVHHSCRLFWCYPARRDSTPRVCSGQTPGMETSYTKKKKLTRTNSLGSV